MGYFGCRLGAVWVHFGAGLRLFVDGVGPCWALMRLYLHLLMIFVLVFLNFSGGSYVFQSVRVVTPGGGLI